MHIFIDLQLRSSMFESCFFQSGGWQHFPHQKFCRRPLFETNLYMLETCPLNWNDNSICIDILRKQTDHALVYFILIGKHSQMGVNLPILNGYPRANKQFAMGNQYLAQVKQL